MTTASVRTAHSAVHRVQKAGTSSLNSYLQPLIEQAICELAALKEIMRFSWFVLMIQQWESNIASEDTIN